MQEAEGPTKEIKLQSATEGHLVAFVIHLKKGSACNPPQKKLIYTKRKM